MVEFSNILHGCPVFAVEAVRRVRGGLKLDIALEEVNADRPGSELTETVDRCPASLSRRVEPVSLVDLLCDNRAHLLEYPPGAPVESELRQILVGLSKKLEAGRLIDPSRLDTDKAILDGM